MKVLIILCVFFICSCSNDNISREEVSKQINDAGQDTVKKFRDVKANDNYPLQ